MTAGDAGSLLAQYGTPDKLQTRSETRRLYSEAPGTFVEWVLDVLDPAPGDVVLDAGCGPGLYHAALAARGARVVGVDLFGGMVREALGRASGDGREVEVAQASVEALPFASGVFDRVMCNHMLYHVPDQAAALGEIRRVVRARGRVVLSTNAADNMAVLDALHRRACADLGLKALVEMEPLRFTFEPDSDALVRSVFPEAEVRMRDDALVFPDADTVLRFYASFLIEQVEEPRPDDFAEQLLGRMRELVGEATARDGRLRVAKRAGCFVAGIAG